MLCSMSRDSRKEEVPGWVFPFFRSIVKVVGTLMLTGGVTDRGARKWDFELTCSFLLIHKVKIQQLLISSEQRE